MNFFNSILSDDPVPPYPQETEPTSSPESDDESEVDSKTLNPNPPSNVGGWSFGGLMKTLASQSESVLETYRRDLQEFGSGLRKETELFREVASRAVKELPASIEVGASVAHGSLESVTQAIDGVLQSTADIISHGKIAASSSSDVESEIPDAGRVSGSARYSRFDAQLNAIQSDATTYSEEPEDLEDYEEWKSGFSLDGKGEEVENLIGENGVLEGVYGKFVPNVVDSETFWCRYFYRVDKLKQQERMRASLVKRAISIDDEEELSWDVDDDDETLLYKNANSEGHKLEKKELGEQNPFPAVEQKSTTGDEKQKESPAAVGKSGEDKFAGENIVVNDENNVVESREVIVPDEKTRVEGNSPRSKPEGKLVKEDENKALDGNGDQTEPTKLSDVSIVSSQQSAHNKEEEEEEDMGWDEIEDIGSGDEKKAHSGNQDGSPNRAEVRKRLSTAEEDEDLSWDIEDDD